MLAMISKNWIWKGCLVGVLSLMCSGIVFVGARYFPQADGWVVDWQLRHFGEVPLDDSLVLISIKKDSQLFCEKELVNPKRLAGVLWGMDRAGAKVIAPAVMVGMPVPSECGGLPGLVRLADVTQQAGTIVYPEGNPAILSDVARGFGRLSLEPDQDGVLQDSLSPRSSSGSQHPSFAQAIHASISKRELPDASLQRFPPRRYLQGTHDVPFRTYPYEEIRTSIERQDWDRLTHQFQGKVVILLPGGPHPSGETTSWTASLSPAMVHVWWLNAMLTDSWATQPHGVILLLGTSVFGAILGMGILSQRSIRKVNVWVVGSLLIAGLITIAGIREGWVFPLGSMAGALGLTCLGVIWWKVWTTEELVEKRILEGERELARLHQELVGKRSEVQQLVAQLQVASKEAQESHSVIQDLHESQHSISHQLIQSQAAMESTQDDIRQLEQELERLRTQVPALPPELSPPDDAQTQFRECESFQILTRDSGVLRVFQDLKKAAITTHPILLMGETGTGKEVFAQAAHQLSPRRHQPFISVNMAAIHSDLFEGELFGDVKGAFTGAVGRQGYLEAAHGGTLFLDEVGELPPPMQAKLLRVLENGTFHRVGDSRPIQVDVRIVAATNRDLQKEVEAGRYREDLYYRLRSIVITLPPLRQRSAEDRIVLAHRFFDQFTDSHKDNQSGFSQGALDAILAYSWPGNIRELRQTIAQAVALKDGAIITEGDLQLKNQEKKSVELTPGQPKAISEGLEDTLVLDCLRLHKFDMQATARSLGWDRSTVTQRLKGLGFQALVESQGNIEVAARVLAGDPGSVRVVERRLREYAKNLFSQSYPSLEEAVADCRKRFRNLPERYFPAVERLLQREFSLPSS